MYFKESNIDNPRINKGKILNKTIPAPSKINDGISKIIFAIMLSPIRFWTNTDCDCEICHINNKANKRNHISK